MKEEPDTMEPNAEEQADPFNLAYDMLKDRDREIRELQATIAALRSQIVEWKPGGAFGTSEPIPEPKWDFQQFILGTLEFSKQVELFHVEYGHRLQWVYKTPDLREWEWSDIVKWCSVKDFPLPQTLAE